MKDSHAGGEGSFMGEEGPTASAPNGDFDRRMERERMAEPAGGEPSDNLAAPVGIFVAIGLGLIIWALIIGLIVWVR